MQCTDEAMPLSFMDRCRAYETSLICASKEYRGLDWKSIRDGLPGLKERKRDGMMLCSDEVEVITVGSNCPIRAVFFQGIDWECRWANGPDFMWALHLVSHWRPIKGN